MALSSSAAVSNPWPRQRLCAAQFRFSL